MSALPDLPPPLPLPDDNVSARLALCLLALDPHLAGVALWAEADVAAPLVAWYRALLAALDPAAPWVEVPASVTPDRLLGGLDLGAALATGQRVARPGLLARAHGGTLYLPGGDRLPVATAALVRATLAAGVVRLEREGLSAIYPLRCRLLVGLPLADGTSGPGLWDQAGLWVVAPDWDRVWSASASDALSGVDPLLIEALRAARRRLPDVIITDAQVATLVTAALGLGVAGQRADGLTARAACALAALARRTAVIEADLIEATALVLSPRAGQIAPSLPPSPPAPPPPDPPAESDADGGEVTEPGAEGQGAAAAERLIAAAPTWLPTLAPPLHRRTMRSGQLVEAGRRAAANAPQLPAAHGVPASTIAAPQPPPGLRLALADTLRAAAPFQPLRRAGRAATGPAVLTRAADLRWVQRRAPVGVLFLLVVDASGSMARNRLAQAKGAALLLLARAYLHRDRVALIAFRGAAATLLLPPTRSTAQARRLLEQLPAGGGTPLASALALSLQVARRTAAQRLARCALVVLTDGRANVPLAGPPENVAEEVTALAGRWAALVATGTATTLVIDTRLRYVGGGDAAALATTLGGQYLYLPQAAPDAVRLAAETSVLARGWR